MDLSIIVPLYNEAANVVPLYNAILAAVNPLELDYEILYVDDGSTDATFPEATKIARRDTRLRVVKLRRNYGQTPAMVAGITHARGRILVTMDGDLQNDPADIPHFIEKIDEGYDLVVGWRYKRQDNAISRKLPSKIANWLIGKVTGIPIKDNGCSLKAYRARIIKSIPLYSEMHRFIPAMTSVAGTRIAEIKVNHHPRRFGRSKYGLSRTYKVLLDLLTIKVIISFLARPMVAFAGAAGVAAVIGIVALIGGVAQSLQPDEQVSIVLLGVGILYAALAIAILFWGVLAELIYKTGDVKAERFARLRMVSQDARFTDDHC